ncbi:MAG TPA: hypothetical protein DCP67_02205 [Planctomycetaceae bacterium]|jgi:membrane-associated protease RseP (regulator of RpoE activity)|nr:hypothetical protein [Rhodopirellula sp.]MCH2359755.1 site-2 protease family protein [Pirellulales bacterium]HAL12598.1 hypothetical protein [Planctomycetaceae bacterium]HCK71692.1 hypothetical protein [Planctomycetaceae bacterium]HCP84424.1 hypothetical protein [Planctomycetaceae bacterium]
MASDSATTETTTEIRHSQFTRKWKMPALFFCLTLLTTFLFGAGLFGRFQPMMLIAGDGMLIRESVILGWLEGVLYMACVIAILLSHELGHFVATLKYRIPSTYPIFLPSPLMIGTFGAVIAMDGRKADRKEIFDIGIAGPLAGLVICIPVLMIGISRLDIDASAPSFLSIQVPWIVKLLAPFSSNNGDVPWLIPLEQVNPMFLAGWVGLFVTGLNMMPVSQLDGGHVTYTIFGRAAHWIARGFMVAVIATMTYFESYNLMIMVVLVMFMGPDHPPTRDDTVRLGKTRTILGLISLVIPILCFPPEIVVINTELLDTINNVARP